MDMLARGAAWLEQQRLRHMASPATYVRDGVEVRVNATSAKATAESDTTYESVTIDAAHKDFIIAARELKIDRACFLPRRGDLIKEIRGRHLYIYEVLPLGSEAAFRYCDTNKAALRIHTKEIGMEMLPRARKWP